MRPARGLGRAYDGLRHEVGKPCAYLSQKNRSTRSAGSDLGSPHTPDNPLVSREPSCQAAEKVGVIHPRLDDVRLQSPYQFHESPQRPRKTERGAHTQYMHVDTASRELLADFAGRGQGTDDMTKARLLEVRLDQALKHELSAVGVQRNDDMEKLHCPGCRFSGKGPSPRNRRTRVAAGGMRLLTGTA